MNTAAQNLAVILIVGVCFAYIAWHAIQAFRGRKSKLGRCCAKGCEAAVQAKDAETRPAAVQFLPLANVGRRIHKS